jgi:hypothetical protein
MKILALFFILFSLTNVNLLQNCQNDFCNITSSSFYSPSKNCFCSHCDQYEDCCEDMIYPDLPRLASLTVSECNIKLNQSLYAYSLSKCDRLMIKDVDEPHVALCENVNQTDVISYIPVYSIQTNLTYRNIYCARCNMKQINFHDLRFFSIKTLPNNIDMNEDEKELTQNILEKYFKSEGLSNNKQNFEIEFENPIENKNIRYCVKSIETCPDNSSEIEKELCIKNPTAYRY